MCVAGFTLSWVKSRQFSSFSKNDERAGEFSPTFFLVCLEAQFKTKDPLLVTQLKFPCVRGKTFVYSRAYHDNFLDFHHDHGALIMFM